MGGLVSIAPSTCIGAFSVIVKSSRRFVASSVWIICAADVARAGGSLQREPEPHSGHGQAGADPLQLPGRDQGPLQG